MNARSLYDLGYKELVSVVPPGARLTANSKLDASQLGKVPGKRSHSGEWYGYNWQGAGAATLREVAQWTVDGANIGVRAASFPAVDIDCTDAALVSVIREIAVEVLGYAPERIGRAPKSLLMYRTAAPFGRMRLWLDGRKHLVEVLGDGQQYVMAGIHAVTKRPYVWPNGVAHADALPMITREKAEAFLAAVADAADMLGYTSEREGQGGLSLDREAINQTALVAADLNKLAQAVALIPNDNDTFPGRDDYLRIGYAIKAAAGEAGFEMFADWAGKWCGNENYAGNDAETIAADWERMKPPFEVGAHFLFETAREYGYNDAGDEFEAIDAPAEAERAESAEGGAIAYSDAALASRFLKKHAHEIRYCSAMGGWMVWDGVRWSRDDHRKIRYWAGRVCKAASGEALLRIEEKGTAHKVATRVASNSCKNAMIDFAADNPAIAVRADQFDANPMLLNTPAGIFNLETGVMMKHTPEHLMTKVTKCGPSSAKPELWLAFLDEATGGDKDLQSYLQRFAGYSLTGLTREHVLAFFHGEGGNGKGTFLNTLTAIWNDYQKVAQMTTFISARIDAHPTALADLAGARLVTAQETEKGRRWDEAKIKSITGGDPVTARFMREDFFTYQPQFKLLFSGNWRPTITNLDAAMRRRFHLVPFTIKPKKVDNTLTKRLEAEFGAILQWAIDGTAEWLKHGLTPPRAILEATADYFDDEDPYAQWTRERTTPGREADFVNSHALYEDWREWCGMTGENPQSEKRFVQTLQQRGFTRKKQGGTGLRGFVGLRLNRTPGSEFATV